jgi:hypothetical protein
MPQALRLDRGLGDRGRRLCRRSILREGIEEAVPADAFDELTFVRRSAFDTNGERKTVISVENDKVVWETVRSRRLWIT